MNNKEAAVQEALGTLDLHAVVNAYNARMVGVFSSLKKAREYIKSLDLEGSSIASFSIYKYELDRVEAVYEAERWSLKETTKGKWVRE
ncbi:hypothetical protein LCGC14_2980690 [marine sediment metagenome]|uniref:Uncharacterized protein n=1 Tax=marine sediment metagenome TaxID=412755 RepID=A0A0F8ZE75_9ZZZZ